MKPKKQIVIKNCTDNRINRKNVCENEAIWHTYGDIMIS